MRMPSFGGAKKREPEARPAHPVKSSDERIAGAVVVAGIAFAMVVGCGGGDVAPTSPTQEREGGAASSTSTNETKCPSPPLEPTEGVLARSCDPKFDAMLRPGDEAPASNEAGPPLPPPKPTEIPLATTGDPKLDALLQAGDEAFARDDVKAAGKAYDEAKKAAPKRAAPIVGVARVRVREVTAGNFGFASAPKNPKIAAIEGDLRRAVGLEPTFGPAHVELGRTRLLLGDAAGAESELRKGIELLPADPEAHSALGVALLALGKREEALVEVTRARDLDPGSGARRGNLGTVLFMNGKVDEAIGEYRIAVKLQPDEPQPHSDLGTALLARNDVNGAVVELRRAIALDESRATFRSNLGYALQRAGRRDEAIAEYKKATSLDPKLVSAWVNLATALAQDPATRADARKALEIAKKLDATDPRVKANLEELDALEKESQPAHPF